VADQIVQGITEEQEKHDGKLQAARALQHSHQVELAEVDQAKPVDGLLTTPVRREQVDAAASLGHNNGSRQREDNDEESDEVGHHYVNTHLL
jgi:hypothetical protein